jgi:putative redox protein
MSLRASAQSVPGTLRQEVLVDGAHRFVTDEPESVGGDGSAPTPHELLPAALASCVSTMIVMYARTKHWPLDGVEVDVDYDQRATPRRFEIGIRLSGPLTDAQAARLEKVAGTCPVKRALEGAAEVVEQVEVRRPHRADAA